MISYGLVLKICYLVLAIIVDPYVLNYYNTLTAKNSTSLSIAQRHSIDKIKDIIFSVAETRNDYIKPFDEEGRSRQDYIYLALKAAFDEAGCDTSFVEDVLPSICAGIFALSKDGDNPEPTWLDCFDVGLFTLEAFGLFLCDSAYQSICDSEVELAAISKLANAHHPEHYLAWLEMGSLNTIDAYSLSTKVFQVECPVDVFVYDSNGNLVASIEDNTITKESKKPNVGLDVVGDIKFVGISNSEYSVKLVGNDDGSMDCFMNEHNGNSEPIRTVNVYDMPLQDGTTYEQTVEEKTLDKNTDYSFTTADGESVETDYDSLLSRGKAHNITLVNAVSLWDTAKSGERVSLHALIPDGYVFDGWECDSDIHIENPTSPSTDFVMPDKDVTITAKLSEVHHNYKISEGQLVCDCGDIYHGVGLITLEDQTYYLEDGKLVSGFVTISQDGSEKRYYFHPQTYTMVTEAVVTPDA